MLLVVANFVAPPRDPDIELSSRKLLRNPYDEPDPEDDGV